MKIRSFCNQVMKRSILTVLALGLTNTLQAQTVVSGVVKDAESGETMPYVSIGIKNLKQGTSSGRNGSFHWTIPGKINDHDTVFFSCIGYETAAYPVSKLTEVDSNEIRLVPKPLEAEAVVVKSGKPKNQKLGHSSTVTRMLSSPLFDRAELDQPDTRGREIGTTVQAKNDSHANAAYFYVSSK